MEAGVMSELLHVIRERHSARGPFDENRPVRQGDLKLVLEAGRWAPTAHNMQNYEIVVVDDKAKLAEIGKIPTRISETFIRENYQQLSFSKEELLRKKTGILAAGFPPSWTTGEAKLGKVPDSEKEGHLMDRLGGTPTLLIVTYDPRKRAPDSEGDRWGVMSLGCLMENMWLMAQSLDLAFHVMVAFAEDGIEKEVKRILGIPASLKIAFGCRVGYPLGFSGPYFRVRRDAEDFTHHNSYGQKGLT